MDRITHRESVTGAVSLLLESCRLGFPRQIDKERANGQHWCTGRVTVQPAATLVLNFEARPKAWVRGRVQSCDDVR